MVNIIMPPSKGILPDGCDNNGPYHKKSILITRDLTEAEQTRLKASKTENEVENLVYFIKEINEPVEYEVDIRR